MSMFGRALGGLGKSVSEVSNKYIDANIQMAKAEALAEMQNRYQLAGAKALDEYNMNPERQARITGVEADRARALGTARNETELAGRRALAGDTALSEAEIAAENRKVLGTVGAKVEAEKQVGKAKIEQEIAKATAMLPLEVKLAYARADAAGRASARHREAPGADLAAKLAIVEKSLGRPLTEPEKAGLFGLAKASARDPELDTQTVTEERMNPDGTSTKIVRKEVRRPGHEGTGTPAPFKDGTELKGKDGQIYVVKDGDAVLKSSLQTLPGAGKTPPKPFMGPQEQSIFEKARSAVGSAVGPIVESAKKAASTEGSEYNAIDTRVREAGRGGPPLTQAERALARKYGISF